MQSACVSWCPMQKLSGCSVPWTASSQIWGPTWRVNSWSDWYDCPTARCHGRSLTSCGQCSSFWMGKWIDACCNLELFNWFSSCFVCFEKAGVSAASSCLLYVLYQILCFALVLIFLIFLYAVLCSSIVEDWLSITSKNKGTTNCLLFQWFLGF